MLERTPRLPPPPRAERQPERSTWHGATLTDDYAWLRADNWHEVMRDPSVLDPKIRAYLDARERLHQGRARPHRGAAADAVRRDEGTHQGGRLHGAEPGRPVRLLRALSRRRAASDPLPPAARRRRRDRCCSTATRSPPARRSSSSAARSIRPITGCSPGRPTRRARNIDTLRVRDLGTGSDLPDVISRRLRLAGVDRGFIGVLLRAARRQSSPLARLSPSARHAGGG